MIHVGSQAIAAFIVVRAFTVTARVAKPRVRTLEEDG